jgi:hypothetical protein
VRAIDEGVLTFVDGLIDLIMCNGGHDGSLPLIAVYSTEALFLANADELGAK